MIVEMFFISADKRYSTRMALQIVLGAEWAVRALKTTLLHGESSDSNPCVLNGFDACFDTSSDLVRKFLQLNMPTKILKMAHKNLSSAHPYSSAYENLRNWTSCIPIQMPDLIRRLNLITLFFSFYLYKGLSLEARKRKEEGQSHIAWYLSN